MAGSNHAVAAELGVSRATVSRWRSRFLTSRLEGLTDEPRPGRARTASNEKVEQVVTAALEQEPPGGDTHWSTRSMTEQLPAFTANLRTVLGSLTDNARPVWRPHQWRSETARQGSRSEAR
jgi:hypothetical protein